VSSRHTDAPTPWQSAHTGSLPFVAHTVVRWDPATAATNGKWGEVVQITPKPSFPELFASHMFKVAVSKEDRSLNPWVPARTEPPGTGAQSVSN
jgi:hypothetical protein